MNKIILLIHIIFLNVCKNNINKIERNENEIQQELKYNSNNEFL